MTHSEISTVASPSFLAMMRLRPFAVLFVAEAQSLVGDQLARVALSVLVWDRTGSAAATAVTYALTFLPAVLGGFVLAGIGDRLPRLDVVVGCDVARAALFTAMVLPGVPLIALEVMLVLAVFLEPVFSASQSSYLADELTTEQYRSATGFRMATHQIGQIGGFAIGGALVVLVDARGALAINALTFLVSAILIFGALRRRNRTVGEDSAAPLAARRYGPRGARSMPAASWRITAEPRAVYLIALTSLAGLFVIPEGLAIPYGQAINISTGLSSLLLAAIPAGGALGALLLIRAVPPARRHAVAAGMAIGCGLPLVVTACHPFWPIVAVAWFASGAAGAYQVEIVAELVHITPSESRARTLGVAGALLTGAQGVGLALFGFIAQKVDVGVVVAVAGVAGTVLAVLIVAREPVRVDSLPPAGVAS